MKRLLIPFLALGIGMASITQSANAIGLAEITEIVIISPDAYVLAKYSIGVVGVVTTLLGAYTLAAVLPIENSDVMAGEIFASIGFICLGIGASCFVAFSALHLGERLVKSL